MTQESEDELATNKRNQDEHDEGEDCPTDVGDRADDFTPAWFPLTPTDAASAILRSTWGKLDYFNSHSPLPIHQDDPFL